MVGQTGKVIIGGAGGVAIPLGLEYLLQGARMNLGGFSTKWSGIVGLGEGVVGLAIGTGKVAKSMTPENRLAAAALGGSGLATGVAIIGLEELRKRAQYTFQQDESQRMARELQRNGGRIGLNQPRSESAGNRYERRENIVNPMIQEV